MTTTQGQAELKLGRAIESFERAWRNLKAASIAWNTDQESFDLATSLQEASRTFTNAGVRLTTAKKEAGGS